MRILTNEVIKISWFSSIPRNSNKDTSPDSNWESIFNDLAKIFEMKNAKRGEKAKILGLIESLKKNKKILINIDSKAMGQVCLEILKPGLTNTFLVDTKKKFDDIFKDNNGIIKKNKEYIEVDGKEIRILLKEKYKYALDKLNSLTNPSTYDLFIRNFIFKIETTAFCKGGSRRARWKLNSINSEYGDKTDCHDVAAKLTYQFLEILEGDLENKEVTFDSAKLKSAKLKCLAELSEKEKNFIINVLPKGVCPLCLRKINLIDFQRNARSDPHSLVIGHYKDQSSRTSEAHKSKNTFWMHRTCNNVQGISTIEEIIPMLKSIVEEQERKKIDWNERG